MRRYGSGPGDGVRRWWPSTASGIPRWGCWSAACIRGVEALVKELKAAGKNVAIATGKPTAFTRSILERNGMASSSTRCWAAEFDGTRSKKSEVISELLAQYGAEGAVMVGDRDNDVLGARACDIPCIGVAWGYAEPGELLGAGAIALVETAGDLKNLLLG